MTTVSIVVLSLIALLGALWSKKTAWILYVVSLACSAMQISAGPITLLPEHVLLLPMAIHSLRSNRIGGSQSALNIENNRGYSKIIPALAITAMLAWILLTALFSVTRSFDTSQSVRLMIWLSVNILSMMLIASWKIDRVILVSDGLKAMAAVSVLFLITWLAANASDTLTVFVEKDYASQTMRLKGLMLEPNLLASLCLFWICLAYYYRDQLHRRMVVLTSLIMSLVILSTYTRTAVVILLILALVSVYRRWGPIAVASTGTLVLIAFILYARSSSSVFSGGDSTEIGAVLLGRLDSMFDLDSGTGALRLATSEIAWNEMQQAGWIMGNGYNSFALSHESDITSTGQLYLGFLWLSILYDSGIFGVIFFTFSFILFWKILRFRAWAFCVSFIVVSTTTNPIWYAFPWVLGALLLSGTATQLEAKSFKLPDPNIGITTDKS